MRQQTDRAYLTWLWPFIGSVAVVAVAAVVALAFSSSRGGQVPVGSGSAAPVGPLIERVSFSSIVGEYRGWLELQPGSLTVTITAPQAREVRIRHWQSGEGGGAAERTQRQSDGTWVLSWSVEPDSRSHMAVEAVSPSGATETSDTYNLSAAGPSGSQQP